MTWLILPVGDSEHAAFRSKRGGIGLALLSVMSHREPSPNRARTVALQKRSFALTCAIICAYPKPKPLDDPSRDIWRQLVRAASSSTFNLEEADAASSDKDFLAKMRISLREAKEAHVAIRLIVHCKLVAHGEVVRFQDEANQLASIFATIVKNKAENMRTGS